MPTPPPGRARRRIWYGLDILRRPRHVWIIDYPSDTRVFLAAQYKQPFGHIQAVVYPQRSKLKKRTLTNLYNERPAWLADAHRRLDEAVFAAYGWSSDIADDVLLAKLLELNLAQTATQGALDGGLLAESDDEPEED